MSKHYEKHAEQVVSGFMSLLGDEAKGCISEEDMAELTMMVEAAISTAALQELQKASDEVAALSKKLLADAEYYDKS